MQSTFAGEGIPDLACAESFDGGVARQNGRPFIRGPVSCKGSLIVEAVWEP